MAKVGAETAKALNALFTLLKDDLCCRGNKLGAFLSLKGPKLLMPDRFNPPSPNGARSIVAISNRPPPPRGGR